MEAAATPARTGRRWGSLLEAAAVFAAVMLYIWRLRLFHPASILVVLGYVFGSHFAHGESARRLGFGWSGAGKAFPAVLAWAAAIAGTALVAGACSGTLRHVTLSHALAGVAAYAVWGLFQQYLLNGYFLNRLVEFSGRADSRFAPLGAALMFSAAHLPNWFLVGVTFAGGYAAARVYMKYRSLYPLAAAHGLIGYALLVAVPDSVAAGFIIGPRYLLNVYGIYPEFLLF